MDIHNISNELKRAFIENLLKKADIDAWKLEIEEEMHSIIESESCSFSLSYETKDDNGHYGISFTGELNMTNDGRCVPTISEWNAKYQNTESGDSIEFTGTHDETLINYITTIIEFSAIGNQFEYDYRHIKNNGVDDNVIDSSFLGEPDTVWMTIDSTNGKNEKATKVRHYQLVEAKNQNKKLAAIYDEKKEEYRAIYINDYGKINLPADMTIEYKEQQGLLLDFLKMELNNRAKTDKEIQIPSKFEYKGIEENPAHEFDMADIIVRTTRFRCVDKDHKLERIRAVFKVLKGKEIITVEAEAMHCVECNEYYIAESEYKRLCKSGMLCHKVYTRKEYLKAKSDYSNWSEKSLLAAYGYSANDQDDLTEQGRHNKIQMVIAIGAMTPTQVISHLEWLVRKRGHRCPSAKIKWENDIAYVKTDMEITGAVIVRDIYRKEYHRWGE